MIKYYIMKCIYVVAVLILVLSCTSGGKNQGYVDDIKSLESSELVFTEYPIEPMLGTPYRIEYIKPYLILDNLVEDKALLIYNMDDDSFVSTIPVGNGPNDILFPIEIQIKDRDIYIMERQTGKCRKYALSALLNDSVSSYEEIKMPNSDLMAKTNDSYIGSGCYNGGMIRIFNNESKVVNEVKAYPSYFDAIKESSHKYKLGQGSLCFNAEHNRLIVAPVFLNCIDVYSYQLNTLEKLDSLVIGECMLKERILENGENVNIEDSDIYYCEEVCCSKDYFYVLYNGSTMAKRNETSSMYILKLTMDGSLDTIYKVNSQIKNICVSNDDSIIYAILLNKDLDYVIAKAELK